MTKAVGIPSFARSEFAFNLPVLEHAACREVDPEIFFPEQYMSSASSIKTAKETCAACQDLEPCRNFALEHGVLYGIWGGTTVLERRTLRRLGGYSQSKSSPVGG